MDGDTIDRWMVDAFLAAHDTAPEEIVVDLDATDDPIHGQQEGRFFHGYYRHYCYLPLYIFCGEYLLCARLRRSNIDGVDGAVDELKRIVGQIRQSWPASKHTGSRACGISQTRKRVNTQIGSKGVLKNDRLDRR